MGQNQNLSLRESAGLFLARATGKNRDNGKLFYGLLKQTVENYDLMNIIRCSFNVDENRIQIKDKSDGVTEMEQMC